MNSKTYIFIILIYSLFLFTLYADEVDPETSNLIDNNLVEEAKEPTSFLWSYELDDTEVDIYWSGYWKFKLLYGASAEWTPNGMKTPGPMSMIQPGLRFLQEPDFLVSLWINQSFFLEASYADGADNNHIRLGYETDEDQFFRRLVLGNSQITAQSFAGIDVPSPENNALSAALSLGSDKSFHDLLVRYDGSLKGEVDFIGNYEVEKEQINLYDWQKGRVFYLPNENIDNFKLYIEDSNGPYSSGSTKYRIALADEYSIDLANGILILTEPAQTRLAVYYEKAGNAIGSPALSGEPGFIPDVISGTEIPDPDSALITFLWTATDPYNSGLFSATSQVTINSDTSLLIFSPGLFSPFEAANRYNVNMTLPSEAWKLQLYYMGKNSSDFQSSTNINFKSDSINSEIELLPQQLSIRDVRNRYPFIDDHPELYGPGGVTNNEIITHQMNLVHRVTETQYSLPSDVVGGSVRIFINGRETNNWRIINDKIEFSNIIFPNDYIRVTYSSESADLTDGTLFVYQGNSIELGKNLDLEISERVEWELRDNSWSSADDNSSPVGEIELAVALDFQNDNLNFNITESGMIRTPNGSDLFRIMGMENNQYSLTIAPSMIQKSLSGTTDLNFITFTEPNPPYEDTYYPWNWAGASVDAGKSGASAALTIDSDPFSGIVMVCDYSLTAGESSASDILINTSGETSDLSDFSSISFWIYSVAGDFDDIDLIMQIGENGEKSDHNGDSILEPADSLNYISKDFTTDLAAVNNGTWRNITINLTNSERNRLMKSRSLQLQIAQSANSPAGRILIGGFKFTGSSFLTNVVDNSQVVDYLQKDKIESNEISDGTLGNDFPSEIAQFHPSGSAQRVTEIRWGSDIPTIANFTNATDGWQASSATRGFYLEQYKKLVFFFKSSATGVEYSFKLEDSQNRGLQLNWTADDTTWQRCEISLENNSVNFSGSTSAVSLNIDNESSEISKVVFGSQNSQSGTFLIDELYLKESVYSISSTTSATFSWGLQKEIISGEKGFLYFGNPNIEARGNYFVSTGIKENSTAEHSFDGSLLASAEILETSLSANIDVNLAKESQLISGGHSITAPARFEYFKFTDNWTTANDSILTDFSHSTIIYWKIGNNYNGDFDFGSTIDNSNLKQYWKSNNSLIIDKFSFTPSLMLQQNSYESWNKENYFSDWFRSWQYFIRDFDNEISRNGFLSIPFSLNFDNSGYKLTSNLLYNSGYSPLWSQNNQIDTTLDANWNWKDKNGNGFLISTSYQRSLSYNKESISSDNFGTDISHYFDLFSNQLPLINYVPFVEFFGDYSFNNFKSNSIYSDTIYRPEWQILFSRDTTSVWWELFAPSSIEYSISRDFKEEGSSSHFNSNQQLTLNQQTINLFGKLGRYPTFNFYTVDRYENSFILNFNETEVSTWHFSTFNWQSYWEFKGLKESLFSIENNLSFNLDENTTDENIALLYTIRGNTNPTIKLGKTVFEYENYYFTINKASCNISYNQSTNQTQLDIYLTHESHFMVQGIGSLKGWITLGTEQKADSSSWGFELGVELTIGF